MQIDISLMLTLPEKNKVTHNQIGLNEDEMKFLNDVETQSEGDGVTDEDKEDEEDDAGKDVSVENTEHGITGDGSKVRLFCFHSFSYSAVRDNSLLWKMLLLLLNQRKLPMILKGKQAKFG